jgi:hypothetical protein
MLMVGKRVYVAYCVRMSMNRTVTREGSFLRGSVMLGG